MSRRKYKVSWETYGAKRQGKSHENSNTPCQDSIFKRVKDNVVCVCLSDGAGSAKRSEIGSSTLVESLSLYICNNFDKLYEASVHEKNSGLFQKSIIKTGLQALEGKSKSENKNESINDYAATFLFVAVDIVKKEAIWGHIGDGVIGIKNKDCSYSVLSAPVNGEYANQTVFITSNPQMVLSTMQYGHFSERDLKHISSFFLMSDGPETIFYSKKLNSIISTKVLNWIIERCKKNEALLKKAILDDICTQYSNDDLSMVFLSRSFQRTKAKIRN